MYYAIGVSVPSLHRESTDSLIVCHIIIIITYGVHVNMYWILDESPCGI